jgi:hypothetical protein
VAKNKALVHFLSEALRLPIEMLDEPQIAGAYGAAIIAREEYVGNMASGVADVTTERELGAALSAVAVPHCAECATGHLDGHTHGRAISVTIGKRPMADLPGPVA